MSSNITGNLLNKVGSEGRYQYLILALLCTLSFTYGSSSFFNAYLFYQNTFHCPNNIRNCQQYVCSLSPQQRQDYSDQLLASMVADMGVDRCQTDTDLEQLQALIYCGGIAGMLIGAFLAGFIQKKLFLVALLSLNVFSMTLTIFSTDIKQAALGLGIDFAIKCIVNQLRSCFLIETVSQRLRGRFIIVVYIAFALGVTANGALFYLISSWKIVLLTSQVVPTLTVLAIFVLLIEETPFDLVVYYEKESIHNALLKIAKFNKKEAKDLKIEDVQDVLLQYNSTTEGKTKAKSVSPTVLLKYSSLRSITVLSCLLHFSVCFQFQIPQLVLRDYKGNIFINGAIIGSSQILGSVICYFIVDKYKRKKDITLTSILGIAASLLSFYFGSCNSDTCAKSAAIIQTTGLFLFRLFITIGYNFFYMAQFEVFPTQIRAVALQLTAIASQIAIVVIPLVQEWFESMGLSIIISFAVSSALVLIFTTCLPQTHGKVPPQMITQLQKEEDKSIMPSTDNLQRQQM